MVSDNRIISKIVLCGPQGGGKTSLRMQYMGATFITDHMDTLGADFATKKIKLDDGVALELRIWDLAEQPEFKELRQRFYLGANAAMMVFDLSSLDALKELDTWIEELWSVHPSKSIPIAIIGNKIGQKSKFVSDYVVELYIENLKISNNIPDTFVKYYKTSVIKGENMETCFLDLAQEIIDIVSSEE